MASAYDLDRFVTAQDAVYETVLQELRAGAKRSHWMWYVFPQVDGLGSSPIAKKFALAGRDEASRYLQHPVLGARLVECTELIIALQPPHIQHVLGSPDDLKFHSSLTLFSLVSEKTGVFKEALAKYFRGRPDLRTLELLEDL